MATVSHRHARRQGRYESHREIYRPSRPRWGRRLVIGFTLLAILVLLAPTIIAYTPARSAPLRLALSGIKGTVHAGGASLSWMGPIQYTDIEIRDAQGKPLLKLPKVESQRSLFALVTNLSNLGTFRIERPEVSLTLRPDGSNAEDVLGPWLKKDADSSPSGPSAPPAITIEIVDGKVALLDSATNQQWNINALNLKLRMSPESSLPAEVAVSGEIPVDARLARFAVTGTPDRDDHLTRIEAKVEAVPLALVRGFADRFAPGLQLDGTLAADAQCDGLNKLPDGRLQVTGTVTADDVIATGGPLATDRLALRRIELPCELTCQDRVLDIKQLALRTDVGYLQCAGRLPIPERLDTLSPSGFVRSAFSANGELDLAKVAALLPTTMRVREGVQITSGLVQLSADSTPAADGHTWSGKLTATGMSALQAGRPLAWNEPIQLELAAVERGGNLSIERLFAGASFLQVSGAGTLDNATAEIHCDLDRLTTDFSQFFDFGGARFAGRADGGMKWQCDARGTFSASASAQLQALQILVPGRPTWKEDSVLIAASASGNVENLAADSLASAVLRRLDNAQLNVTVADIAANKQEQLSVQLTQPIEQLAATMRWPLDIRVRGDMGRWWPRIATWIDLPGLELAGGCDVAVQAICTPVDIEIQQARSTFSGLHAWGWDTFFIDEPEARLEGSGRYEFGPSRLTLNRTALLTSSLSMQTESATVALPGAGPFSAQGTVAYQADLGRVMRWINNPRLPPSYALAGILAGNADLAHSTSGTNGRLSAAVDNFAVYVLETAPKRGRKGATTPEPTWTEKKLSLSAAAGLSRATDTLQLTSLNIGSQALTMQATGKIENLSTRQNVALTGKIDYDWKSLSPLLKPYLGSNVRISGRQTRDFAVRGPLGEMSNVQLASVEQPAKSGKKKGKASAAATDDYAFLRPLTADISLGWTRADIYGARVGPIDVENHLEDGTITTRPIEAALGKDGSRGKLSLSPTIRLSPGPAELVLAPGKVATNVEITQELSNSWMKYVAPILAQATRVEGEFSLDLKGARVPLDDPAKSDLGGKLVVHNVSVTPGPLAQPLMLIGQQVEALVKKRPPPLTLDGNSTLMKIDDQEVDFHMVDGRVYHQGLSMQVGEVTIRTRGWVGVDETLGLVAEVPLKPDWIQRSPALAGMRDQVIRIPIEGTLSRPKLDKRVMDQLAGQLLENTARGLIEGELDKQFNRLFPGSQQR